MFSDTIPVRKGEELDLQTIESFLRKHIKDLPNDSLHVKQFSAGKSNLTYQLQIGTWEAVLRRPPLGPVAPKAHGMQREFTILKEIHPHFPVAPKPYVFADENIIGRPFYIMERKRGIVLDTKFPDEVPASKKLCRQISEKMVDTLVKLHQIDYTKTKLKDITKPKGFMERQVYGWINRYERAQTDEIEGIEQLKTWMVNHIPVSPDPTIIHYDFKLNNTMFNENLNEVVGVFDWEMTTVGDPLADLGVAMAYWTEDKESEFLQRSIDDKKPISSYPGFMTKNELMETYSRKSGRDVSNMHFYLTFAYFKLAVICQQIYFRWKKGQTEDERFENLNVYVRNLIQYSLETASKKM
ncbi:phosphotransferase family protein [Cytobacillus depressus]|uniref:Phosphotransferase family protein n=1 Tax=Cytobacillus depressus TaxID=1602942 RepID=A0A6L3VD55_9BACI|nr:phosphotransferase family protein [Cytobacillus depressus]KAB2338583.1 phosphotransferase family protein [Cytobacillus depressus]